MTDEVYDVVIIGGGPAGSTCALYTSRAKLKTVVLERSLNASALAMTPKIANYPGVAGEVPGTELLETMRKQAQEFGAEYIRATVIGVDFESDPKFVYTSDSVFAGRTVVVAAGSMGRSDRLPGEDEYIGRGVSYCATCDAAFFAEKEVAVIGDTDTALEEAIFLTRFAKCVHIIAPRLELKAWRELIESVLENDKIVIHYGMNTSEILGNSFVDGIKVIDAKGIEQRIEVDGVFIFLTGTAPTTDFLRGSLPLSENGCIIVDSDKSTKVPGVFAIGDMICSHIKQAVVAAADGVVAALSIDKHLNKRERVKMDYR